MTAIAPKPTILPGGNDPQQFDWQEVWYPLAFVQDLDKSKPTQFTLLNSPLVIWWHEATQQWAVFRDRCPHRLVPLSEGRINAAGCLECPYHGWVFEGSGQCVSIPFEPEDGNAHKNPRAAAQSLPVKVKQGLLFVYPGKIENAEQTPVPILPPIEENPDSWVYAETFRDIPYDITTLMENVIDASHVSFTHHPRVGNRKNAKDMDLEILRADKFGFVGRWEEGPRRGKLGSQETTFVAPVLMWHDIKSSPFGRAITAVYATPISKGKCRVFARLPFQFSSKIPQLAFKLTPRWYSHLNQNAILEDDQIFLHQQERVLEKTNNTYAKSCYLPTGSDRFIIAYREWLETYGEPFPNEPFPPMEENRDRLLERYYSHTQHCKSCRDSARRVNQIRKGLLIFSAIIWTALPICGYFVTNFWLTAGLTITLAIALGLWWKLKQLAAGFRHGEYPPIRNRRP